MWVTSQAEDAGAPLARPRPPCAGSLKGDRSAGRAGRAGPMASTSSHLVSAGRGAAGGALGEEAGPGAGAGPGGGGGHPCPTRCRAAGSRWGFAGGPAGRSEREGGRASERGLSSVGPASALLLPALVPPSASRVAAGLAGEPRSRPRRRRGPEARGERGGGRPPFGPSAGGSEAGARRQQPPRGLWRSFALGSGYGALAWRCWAASRRASRRSGPGSPPLLCGRKGGRREDGEDGSGAPRASPVVYVGVTV